MADAVQMALSSARAGQPEIRALAVDEASAKAELATLEEALRRFAEGTILAAPPGATQVWIVMIAGQWEDAFPRPPGAATPETRGHFFVILDAHTGEPYMAGTAQ